MTDELKDLFSQEQIQRLLKADLYNLARKVKAGKPLTGPERTLLNNCIGGSESAPEPKEKYAKNKAELSKLLGVSRQTIYNYTKLEGAPAPLSNGKHDVHKWLEFTQSLKGKQSDEKLSKPQLQAKNILLQNKRLEIQIAALEKEYIAVSDVERWVGEMINAAKTVLLSIGPAIAPQVVGLTVPDAEKRITESIIEALEQLHTKPPAELFDESGI